MKPALRCVSQVSVSMFRNFIFISCNGQLDFYEKSIGRRMKSVCGGNKTKFPVRHDYSSIGITVNNKSFQEIRDTFRKETWNKNRGNHRNRKPDYSCSTKERFSSNYNISMRWERNNKNVDTFFVSFHSISVNGSYYHCQKSLESTNQ